MINVKQDSIQWKRFLLILLKIIMRKLLKLTHNIWTYLWGTCGIVLYAWNV